MPPLYAAPKPKAKINDDNICGYGPPDPKTGVAITHGTYCNPPKPYCDQSGACQKTLTTLGQGYNTAFNNECVKKNMSEIMQSKRAHVLSVVPHIALSCVARHSGNLFCSFSCVIA